VADAFYIQQLTTMLDIPIGTVKRRLHTARQRLKQHLEKSHVY